MSAALPGTHLCLVHQGNHSHYAPHNCEICKLEKQRDALLKDLREAAAVFRRYEFLHRAKGTEESLAKAEVNNELATRFEATIAKAAS